MSKPVVYLSGPISGCSWGECTDWRKAVAEELLDRGIRSADPLRGKDYLSGLPAMPHSVDNPMSTPHGIVGRDYHDTARCDLTPVNLLGTTKVSIGTVWEIGVACANRKPVIVVMEPGNIHDHPMVRESAYAVVGTMEEGIRLTSLFLAPWAEVGF